MRPPKAATKTTEEAMNWTAVHTPSHTGKYKHMHALGEIAYPSPFASSNNSQAQICKKVTKPITTMVELPSQTGAKTEFDAVLCYAVPCHAKFVWRSYVRAYSYVCMCMCVWPTCMYVAYSYMYVCGWNQFLAQVALPVLLLLLLLTSIKIKSESTFDVNLFKRTRISNNNNGHCVRA